jgi:hypothetical protein
VLLQEAVRGSRLQFEHLAWEAQPAGDARLAKQT